MLVLSRKEGQSIFIGDDVRITILSSKGGKVRVGIEAPKNITVYREELVKKIAANKEKSNDE